MQLNRLDVVFNACKSKYFIASRRKPMASIVKPAFHVGGKVIEFVQKWPHLGNIVNGNGSD